MESIWHKDVGLPSYKPLEESKSVDVAIIGGGMAGLLTAYHLRQNGRRAVVLEANTIAGGQTGRTTAKITSQHDLIYHKLITELGEEKAKQYADSNEWAIGEYANIIESQGIECDFQKKPAYLYTTEERGFQALRDEVLAAQRLGINASLTREQKLPFAVEGTLRYENQAQFHPLKFLKGIAKELEIYEHTDILTVDGNRLEYMKGAVTAEHIVFACHYPFINKPGYYFMRMHQERSYVIALENAQNMQGMYLGIDPDGLSFRNQGEYLLLGGGNHRTGENSKGGKYERLLRSAKQFWPQSVPVARWSAQDCMTLDSVPYIGRFSSAKPNWYVATGFQKWGMTSSMVAARIITELICEKPCAFEDVFVPKRFNVSASVRNLMEDGKQAVKGLSRELLKPPKATLDSLPSGHGGIVEYQGGKAGVYKDEDGETFIVEARCPHLGCQLEWNPDEKSWDCPCHGSRFDYHGNILDNPAQENIN